MHQPDGQQIELLSRAALEIELIKRGYEIAYPGRDKGIDMLVYKDQPGKTITAIPLQITSSSKKAFRVFEKHRKFRNMILVFVWYAVDNPEFLFMNYKEALKFVPENGDRYWKKHQCYRWNRVSKEMAAALESRKNRWSLIEETFRRI